MTRPSAWTVWLAYRGVWGFIGTLSWTTAAVYFIRDVGMSPLELVLAGTSLELAYFVFEIPTGVVADLCSRRLSMIVAAAVSGLAMLLIGAVDQVGPVMVGMALWGFGWTFRSGAQDAWLADEVGKQRLGAAYQRAAQVARITGLLGIGAAVVLAAAALRLPFLAAGGVALALAVFLAVAMPEGGSRRQASSTAGWSTLRATVADGALLVRRTPVLLLVLGIFLFVGAFEEGFDRLWEAHLLIDVGLPPLGGGLGAVAWFGILGAATLLLSAVVSVPIVRRIEQLAPRGLARLLLVLHAALMGCALAFALAGSVLLAVTAYLATTVVRDLTAPVFQTWLVGNISDSSRRATVLSLTSVFGSLGEWAGGPALGFIGTRWTVRTALAAGALMLTPVLFLLGRAVRHHGSAPQSVDPALQDLAQP